MSEPATGQETTVVAEPETHKVSFNVDEPATTTSGTGGGASTIEPPLVSINKGLLL